MTDLRPARAERAADIERGHRVVPGLLVSPVSKLKARFVDGGAVQDRGLSNLNVLVSGYLIEASLRQIEAPNAFVICRRPLKVVTNNERITGVYGVVEARAEEQVTSRHQEPLTKVDNVEVVVEHGCPDEFVVVCIDAGEIEKE